MSYWDSNFNNHFNSSSQFPIALNGNTENRLNLDYNYNIFSQSYSSQHFPGQPSYFESKYAPSSAAKNYPSGIPEPYRYESSPYFSRTHDNVPFEKAFPLWRNDEKKNKCSTNQSIQVTLENKALLERFDNFCTEMIITKSGRRMFPSPLISVKGLQSSKKYFILLDIVPADDNRYKFQHYNWVVAGKAEPTPPPRMYIHPESPLAGSHWMKQKISFGKVKLTNNVCDQMGHIVLNSMHRYQPRIHVVEADDVYSMQFQPFHTYVFPECRFIAVTAYQNSQVTNLKIENNPFAKGFREIEKQKRAKRKLQTEGEYENGAEEQDIKQNEDLTKALNPPKRDWSLPVHDEQNNKANHVTEEKPSENSTLNQNNPLNTHQNVGLFESYNHAQMYCEQAYKIPNSNENFNFSAAKNFEPSII